MKYSSRFRPTILAMTILICATGCGRNTYETVEVEAVALETIRRVEANGQPIKSTDYIPPGSKVVTGLSASAELLTTDPPGAMVTMLSNASLRMRAIRRGGSIDFETLIQSDRIYVNQAPQSAYDRLIVSSTNATAATQNGRIEVTASDDLTVFRIQGGPASVRVRACFEREFGPAIASVPYFEDIIETIEDHAVFVNSGEKITIRSPIHDEVCDAIPGLREALAEPQLKSLIQETLNDSPGAIERLESRLGSLPEPGDHSPQLSKVLSRPGIITRTKLSQSENLELQNAFAKMPELHISESNTPDEIREKLRAHHERSQATRRTKVQKNEGRPPKSLRTADGKIYTGYIRELGNKYEIVSLDGELSYHPIRKGDIYPWNGHL